MYLPAGLAAKSINRGLLDGWVIKINANEGIVCQKTLGGSSEDAILGMAQNNDGNFEFGGSSSSPDGDIIGFRGGSGRDAWFMKFQHN